MFLTTMMTTLSFILTVKKHLSKREWEPQCVSYKKNTITLKLSFEATDNNRNIKNYNQ